MKSEILFSLVTVLLSFIGGIVMPLLVLYLSRKRFYCDMDRCTGSSVDPDERKLLVISNSGTEFFGKHYLDLEALRLSSCPKAVFYDCGKIRRFGSHAEVLEIRRRRNLLNKETVSLVWVRDEDMEEQTWLLKDGVISNDGIKLTVRGGVVRAIDYKQIDFVACSWTFEEALAAPEDSK